MPPSRPTSPPTPGRDEALARIRALLRDRTRRATTAGYGPRFLHSTGQLHKGGAPIGWFLQLTADHPADRPIPGKPYTLRPAHRRPGGRRPERAPCARPAGPARPSRPRPRRRPGRARAGPRSGTPGGLTVMRIGFIGLGRMGANMVRRLLRDGHEIVAYNRTAEKTREIAGEGATPSFSLEELVVEAGQAARGLGDGPGRRRDRGPDRRADGPARAGRHDRRRRQHELPRRRPPPRQAGRRRASATSTRAYRAGSGAWPTASA